MKNSTSIFKFIGLILGFLIQTNSSAQLGVGPAPYCMPSYNAGSIPCNQPGASNAVGNTINDFIDSFNTTGAMQNLIDNSNGCQTQTIASAQVNYFFKGCPTYLRVLPGQTITCNLRSGTIYDQGFAVFVDWNSNSLFDIPAERVAAVVGLPIAATWTSCAFTVPAAQPNGTYRLRVRCAYVTTGGLIDPCTNYSFGETQDYYLFIGGNCSALPVELLGFDGQFKQNEVNLNWNTATEKNSDYFTIERSYDNERFEFVSKTPASGTSHTIQAYSAVDKQVKQNGIVYYRLKQFDKGNVVESLSQTISVYANERNLGFDLFPNPASTEMTLVLSDVLAGKTITIGVYDNNGKMVQSTETVLTNYNTTQNLNISELEKGTYFVKILDDTGDIVMKKILLKQ